MVVKIAFCRCKLDYEQVSYSSISPFRWIIYCFVVEHKVGRPIVNNFRLHFVMKNELNSILLVLSRYGHGEF